MVNKILVNFKEDITIQKEGHKKYFRSFQEVACTQSDYLKSLTVSNNPRAYLKRI